MAQASGGQQTRGQMTGFKGHLGITISKPDGFGRWVVGELWFLGFCSWESKDDSSIPVGRMLCEGLYSGLAEFAIIVRQCYYLKG